MIPTAWARGMSREAFDKAGREMDAELGQAFAEILDREIGAVWNRAQAAALVDIKQKIKELFE